MLRWYRWRGYRPLDRNWHCRHGELDLVVSRGTTVVFCEVKTRTSARFGVPEAAVTSHKQARIRRLALAWLAAHPDVRFDSIRFDVGSVLDRRVRVNEGAF